MRPPELYFNELFVYCDFIKPGKHSYIVSYEKNLIEPEKTPEKEPTKFISKYGIEMNIMNKRKKRKQELFIPITSTVKATSYHEFIGHAFLGDYKINTKINKFNSIERVFEKEKSVFKDWKLDKEDKVVEGFLDEVQYWRISGVVKEEEECAEIRDYLTGECVFLKTIFVVRSALSSYPVISRANYENMIKDFEILDNNFDLE